MTETSGSESRLTCLNYLHLKFIWKKSIDTNAMGLAFSSPSINDASNSQTSSLSTEAMSSQTPRKRRLPQRTIIPSNTITRRSRRIAKSNPRKIVFPTNPKAKSPFCKSYPLTPITRGRMIVKPILRTPRFTKKKVVQKKKQEKKKYNKSVLEMVPGSPGLIISTATEYSH